MAEANIKEPASEAQELGVIRILRAVEPERASVDETESPSVDRAATARHATETVDAAMSAMDDKDQLILRMRFWDGRKVPEIGRTLGLDQKNVYKRIAKLLAQLKLALERSGITAGDLAELLDQDSWARYERMKLPPERVAELRAELQRRIEKARADGVYEGLMKWKGKVHWDIDIDALREDRD
jgi:hypothetical protein